MDANGAACYDPLRARYGGEPREGAPARRAGIPCALPMSVSAVVPPVRGLGRCARHSLVVAGLAALIALGAAASGTRSPAGAGDAGGGSLGAVRSLLGLEAVPAPSMSAPPASPPPAPIALRLTAPAPPATPQAAPPPASEAASRPAAASPTAAPAALPRFEAPPAAGDSIRVRSRERGAGAVHATATPRLEPGDRALATVSFYYCAFGSGSLPAGDGGNFCGAMRDGAIVYPGAAACDYAYLGQRFRIEGDPAGRVYTCHDTGSAVHGLHRDIWFHASDDGWRWQRAVGTRAVIEVVP